MSYYYEVVSEDYNIIKNKWYFLLFELTLENLNFRLENEVVCLDYSNDFEFYGEIKHIANTQNIFRVYCKNKKLDLLEKSDIRFVFENALPTVTRELNKVTNVSYDCLIDDYSVIKEGNYAEVYASKIGRIFFGKITKITNNGNNNYSVSCYDLLNDLMRVYVRKIYYDTTVEDIVLDLINTYAPDLNVEFVPTGQTIEKFFADDYIFNIIKFLATGVGYAISIDGNTLKLKPYGYTEIGSIIDNKFGKILSIDKSINDIVNDVWLFGDKLLVATTQEFTADGVNNKFIVDYSIAGSVKVTINGVELNPDKYVVDDYKGEIKLNDVPLNGDVIKIDYEYEVPIVVHLNDNSSIEQYGLRSKKFTVNSIKSFDVARNLVKQYIQSFKDPKLTVNIRARIDKVLELGFDVGKVIEVKIPERNVSEKLIIKKISYKKGMYADISIGKDDRDIISWYSDIESRLTELEKVEMNKFLFSEYKYTLDEYNVKSVDNLITGLNYDSSEYIDISDRICALMGTFKFIQKFSEPISNLYSISDLSQINTTMSEGIFSIQSIMNIIESLNIKILDILTANLNIDSISSEYIDISDRICVLLDIFGVIQEFGKYISDSYLISSVRFSLLSSMIDRIYSITNNLNITEVKNISILDSVFMSVVNNLGIINMITSIDDNLSSLINMFGIVQEFGKSFAVGYLKGMKSKISSKLFDEPISIQGNIGILESININDVLNISVDNVLNVENLVVYINDDDTAPIIKTFGIIQKFGISWV